MADFYAYHNRTGREHQELFDKLFLQGLRMISLSVYQPANPLYAAVWLKRAGPDWSAVHGLNANEYHAAAAAAAAGGFHPVIVSAAGSRADPVLAGVFEKRDGPAPQSRIGLISGNPASRATIQFWDREAHANNRIMISGARYGMGSPTFAGIWADNTAGVNWNATGIEDDSPGYQRRFEAQVTGWARPAHVTLSASERYLSIFRDDQIGPWFARHHMTSAQYQAEFDRAVPLGLFPISVQAGGSGNATRFAAIFAKQDQPLAREWRVVGSGTASAIDLVMRRALEESGIRGASLSVVSGTRLLFAKGYTNAEPGYPTILPTTPFRIASVAKLFTAIAIHQLIAERALSLTDTVQGVLGLTTPSGAAPDPYFATVTIEDLLLHRSFLEPESAGLDEQVAAAFGQTVPVTDWQVASFMSEKARTAAAASYSNFGYTLLGLVVARLRGTKSYFDAIRATILDRLGMARTRLATSLVSTTSADEARYGRSGESLHDLLVAPSVMTADRPLVSDLYGNLHLENIAGSGGLSSAGVDQARLLAALNLSAQNPVLPRAALLRMFDAAVNSARPRAGNGFDSLSFDGMTYQGFKGGLLATSQNAIQFTLDGIGFALCYNGLNDAVLFGTWWPRIWQAIAANRWSQTANYFSDYGMPEL